MSRQGGGVYILTNECFRSVDKMLVKVGKSSGPTGRIGNLNMSCPENFKVFKVVWTKDDSCAKIETEVFERLWDVRHCTKQCEPTEFLHCSPKRVLEVIKCIVEERGYQVSYSTIESGRSGTSMRATTERTGRRYRSGTCFFGATKCGMAKLEKKGEKFYVVKKLSHITNVGRVRNIFSKRVMQMREAYKTKISSLGVLNCDIPCVSMSEVALFVRGSQTNGKAFWHLMK